MIVPMKKVSLLALKSERESALSALRDLGVMQIELNSRISEKSSVATDELNRIRQIYSCLEQLAAEKKISLSSKVDAASANKIAERVSEINERCRSLENEIFDIRRRLDALMIWGDFDRELLDKINNSGVKVILCIGSAKDFQRASEEKDVVCRELSKSSGKIAFVVTGPRDFDENKFPVVRLEAGDDPRKLTKLLKVKEKEKSELEAELCKLAEKRGDIAALIDELTGVVEFSRVRDSVDSHGEIVVLSGFVPVPELSAIQEAAQKHGWGLLVRDPAADDDVPVLLKNNRFTRLVKPLFDFLGIVPGSREIDISGAVLIFFTIFYAIIIGDAGYGVLFMLISLAGLAGARKAPALKQPMKLLLILSIAAAVWGALCGSWFGFSQIGSWQIPALECFRDFATNSAKQANIQFFCFILAVIQLSAGRIWRVFAERNWRAAGQHIGWMLIIWGNFFLTIRLIVYPGEFPKFMYILYGTGLTLVMACGVNWTKASDVFQFPFDIIGSFTDVLSYIRLFAVALAGACIVSSFNGMAFDLGRVSKWLIPASILVAVAGHALNIALAILSILVHAVRLNTLEFSNHTGVSWSGQSFNPFKSHKNKE